MPAAKGSTPWNAGTSKGWTDKRGYRWLYVIDGGTRRARREHRVIVEQALGRSLEPWEVVHHKDGNPSNNALENLEVIEHGAHTTEHHTGTRKSYDARKSMEAFGQMREALKAERAIKSDLLKALAGLVARYAYDGIPNDSLPAVEAARAAMAKAEGVQP